MSRLDVPRMLASGSKVSSATAIRMAVGYTELLLDHCPHLTQLAISASFGGDSRAQAEFRDNLIALAREARECADRELRCGLKDFDKATRPGPQPGARPHRPARMKL